MVDNPAPLTIAEFRCRDEKNAWHGICIKYNLNWAIVEFAERKIGGGPQKLDKVLSYMSDS